MGFMHVRSFVVVVVVVTALAFSACQGNDTSLPETGTLRAAVTAHCTATVNGVGEVDVESDYLPHVVQCENGAASLEALKAQAVAARSFLYYKLDTSGSINDGTGDQVYSCGASPLPQHYQAVNETAGVVLTYAGATICAFYVAGAIPSASDCEATASDSDPTNTEHYVTYNWNLSGNSIEQTTLGWVNIGNTANRGCKSQNGADCLSDGGWAYPDILRFYYGMDIGIETAVGSCVPATECTVGEVETAACEQCGTRTRTCDGAGAWGDWSDCSGQGECVADAVESEPCGECGMWTRTCQGTCTWGPWSDCESMTSTAPCHTGDLGVCGEGQYSCVAAQLVCMPTFSARPELCDDLDDNCDGQVDEGFPPVLGELLPLYAARLEIISHPDQLDPGVAGPVLLQVENVGALDWPAGAVELRAVTGGGGASLLVADDWVSDTVVLRTNALNAGEVAPLTFDINVSPDATGEIHESFWLARTDASPLACPSPSVTVDVSASGTVTTGIPDAGPSTQPLPKVTTGCSCRSGAGSNGWPIVLFGVLGLLLLRIFQLKAVASRRRR
jgi:Stage II sporulation protein